MGLLDIVTDALNAFNNITFIASMIVCLWWCISSTCLKSIVHFENPLPNLKTLCLGMVNARLGGCLR